MKKLFLFSFLFVFTFSLSACATKVPEETPEPNDQAMEEQKEEPKQEEIKQTNSSNTIDNIEENSTISSPITINGTTQASKNELFIELRDSEHNSKVRGYAVVSENDDAVNTFKITLNFLFNSTKDGFVAAYELDENGQEKNLVEIPVQYQTN
ncbi:hypothetical protein C0584_04285 [Candidatus Parcubacteria bacterium]|nr:MAG: hypothetical protein C0584_04285 [Candidatus Parcubacteria bacterium]